MLRTMLHRLRVDFLSLLALGLFALQIIYQHHTQKFLPDLGIVPPVPSLSELALLSFGDRQFLFRLYSLRLQYSGDTFGRTTALYRYDYPKLNAWFLAMDSLDDRSGAIPGMASYYFAQSQRVGDVTHIVDYLEKRAKRHPENDWWWLVQGAYLAKHKLRDLDRALAIAAPLARMNHIPLWAQQYPAFLHEQRGEFDEAFAIIQHVIDSREHLSEEDLAFMAKFARERLDKLEEAKKLLKESGTQ